MKYVINLTIKPSTKGRISPSVLFLLLSLVGLFQSCLHEQKKAPAPPALYQKSMYELKSMGNRFDAAQGKFRCTIKKPGFNVSFQGIFVLEKNSVFKLQILDPFNNIISFLDMYKEKTQLITPEEKLQFQSFEFVEVMNKQWGITLAPYMVQLIFCGSYVNPLFYSYEEESWLEKGKVICLRLRSLQTGISEIIHYDPGRKIIVKRVIEGISENEAVQFTFTYREEQLHREHAAVESVIPYPVSVEGRTGNGDFILNLEFISSQYRFDKNNGS